MKRYYLSQVIGDGTEENPFRPAVADHKVAWSGVIPSDPVTGRPVSNWCLVIVASPNHAPLVGDTRIDSLPDFPLDGKVSAINTVTKTAMINKMKKHGIETKFVDGTDGYREVIRGVGKKLDPDFSEDSFDVAE